MISLAIGVHNHIPMNWEQCKVHESQIVQFFLEKFIGLENLMEHNWNVFASISLSLPLFAVEIIAFVRLMQRMYVTLRLTNASSLTCFNAISQQHVHISRYLKREIDIDRCLRYYK